MTESLFYTVFHENMLKNHILSLYLSIFTFPYLSQRLSLKRRTYLFFTKKTFFSPTFLPHPYTIGAWSIKKGLLPKEQTLLFITEDADIHCTCACNTAHTARSNRSPTMLRG